ncbi:MAG TPA: carboxypeptidase-like regulatory domain-containing protein [Gemmatimonadaceae bacterium]
MRATPSLCRIGFAVLIVSFVGAQTLAAQTSAAQSGTFVGVVTGDTLGHPVASAEVSLPELNRTTLANAQGEFRFGDVPAGRYAVVVRAIGFQLLTDSISIASGRTLDGELTLSPAVAQLAGVRTTATNAPAIPPRLQEFDARQREKMSGYFLSDSALRRRDRDDLYTLIGMLPGVRVLMDKPASVYLASTHASNSPGPVFTAKTGGDCLFTIYKDGAKLFAPGEGSEPVDFSKIRVEDFYGVEVYPSAAQVPAQYSATGAGGCGVILLWTRPGHFP